MTDIEHWMKSASEDLAQALKLKKVMQKNGLRRARARCHRCGNDTMQGVLAGRRDHMRCWCSTNGCHFSQMME